MLAQTFSCLGTATATAFIFMEKKKKSKKGNNLNKTHGRLLLFLRLGSKWQDHINSLSDDLTFVAKMFDEHVLENFHAGFESVFLLLLKALQTIFYPSAS